METPTYTSNGIQVWKPQPGEYWKEGLKFRESYGGIIAEINDLIVSNQGIPQSYPQNFAGIISALNDLGYLIDSNGLPYIGDSPPGWEVIINPDGTATGGWQSTPPDGQLWFDTRQGRLFIASSGQYWQANGGDGLAQVSPTVPTNPPVIGSTWFDTENEVMYVFVGDGLWQVVKGAGEASLTTATLPLAISVQARQALSEYTPTILPPIPDPMDTQKDYNEWLYTGLVSLDQAINESSVVVSTTPPTENVVSGTLWYDSDSLDLSIWYEDDDGGQWVPTSVSYAFDQDLSDLTSRIATEETVRANAIQSVQASITSLEQGNIADLTSLSTKVTALEDHVNNHPVEVDLTGYATTASVAANVTSLGILNTQIAGLQNLIPDITPLATSAALTELESVVNTLPRIVTVNALIAAAAPDLSTFADQSAIDTAISQIPLSNYLNRTDGTLVGSIKVNNAVSSSPSFDFSDERWYSSNTHKYRTNASTTHYTTFGTTDELFEYAWDFSSNEDFCWIYNDTDKVFSIAKDGAACTDLYLCDFQPNDVNGRVLHNKIDVKDRLTTYQTAFETLRQNVATATNFDELKANILTSLASV